MAALARLSMVLLWGCLVFGVSSCGPEIIVPPRGDGGSGGESVASSSSSSSSSGNPSACILDDVSTWDIEYYDGGGDHPRFATATSGVPWVAFAVAKGNVILEKLGVDDQGIVVVDKFELPDSPVYPLAFDANDQYFVLLSTTGNNWNGSLEIWLVDRKSGAILRGPVGNPSDPNYTIRAALGLTDDGVIVAYARPANNEGVIEIRDANLDVVLSRVVSSGNFQGIWRHSGEFDIYMDKTSYAHVAFGDIQVEYVLPDVQVIGGLGSFLVDIGDQIRLTRGDEVWAGPWPHSQISPPAIVRTYNNTAVFALETELSGVVGYPRGAVLDWMRIESMPGASGIGVVALPVIEERRMGVFYVALDIPHPEQPLRYFGRTCRN